MRSIVMNQTTQPKQENFLLSLVFNILLPIMILNKGHKYGLTPTMSLILALALPLGYGIMDYVQNGRKNPISILGVINTLLTGGLALLKSGGIWFAIKEASIPLAIGIFVVATLRFKKTALESFLNISGLLKLETIWQFATNQGNAESLKLHFKKSTVLLAISFFISAILNFIIGILVFKPIESSLAESVKTQILNEQIAKMTWMGYVAISLPLMLFTGFILWYLFKGLKENTGLKLDEMMNLSQKQLDKLNELEKNENPDFKNQDNEA